MVIAVTESCSVRALWKAAIRNVGQSQDELVALFVPDDRWHRAASLPFTREISRVGGGVSDFTRRRAEQLAKDATDRVRRRIEELASVTESAFAFEVLSESDPKRMRKLVGEGQTIVIAPSFLAGQPICAQFEELDWRIVLIEAKIGRAHV